MHVHTSLSKDSAIPISYNVAKTIKHRGLSGIAVTDHDSFENAARLGRVLRDAGLIAIPSEEVRTTGDGEILCYFLQERVKPGPWGEVLDQVASQGAIAVLAHPFDYIRGNWMRYFTRPRKAELRVLVRGIDGLETFNARNYSPGGNGLAMKYCRGLGLLATGGSDAHNIFEIGRAWTSVSCTSTSIDDILVACKERRLVPSAREDLRVTATPWYKMNRFIDGAVKKAHSGLNSALPAFKRWQSVMQAIHQ